MPSNFWEEQKMGLDIKNFHDDLSEKMGLPNWIRNIQCPFCGNSLPLRSIRGIQLCLNSRNFGEISVEFNCDFCNKMDSIYYRTKIRDIGQFSDYLRGVSQIADAPMIEKDMYNEKYNCLVEEMVKQKG